MKTSNNWIDNIFDSLENVERAIPSNAFLDKIENMAITYVRPINNISKKSVVAIAASLLILITINFSLISGYNNSSQENDVSSGLELTANYNLIPIKTLYNE